MNADAKHKLIRRYEVTDASVHDSQQFDGLLNHANTSADVYADSAYRSAEAEAKLRLRGLRSRIHQRANRNHPLSQAQENANRQKSRVRARIEHVFGAQQTSFILSSCCTMAFATLCCSSSVRDRRMLRTRGSPARDPMTIERRRSSGRVHMPANEERRGNEAKGGTARLPASF